MFSFFKVVKLHKFLMILSLLWPYLWSADREVRCKLVFSIVFNLLAILASISAPIIFARIIDSFSSFHSLSLSYSWFLILLMVYVGIWSLSKIFTYLREIIMFPVMERAIHLLTFDLFQHIQLLPFQYHLKRKTGETVSTLETVIQSFPPIVWSLVFALGPLIVESVCMFGVVAFICGFFYSLILSMCLIFFLIVTSWGFMKAIRPLRRANLSHFATTSKIVDSFLNFSTTKYFHTYNFEFKKIDQVLDSRESKITKALIKNQMIRVYQTLILFLSFLVLMVFTGYDLIHGKLSLGEFIMIHTYMLQFALPLESFGQIFQTLNQSFTKMEKALKIFKNSPESRKGLVKLDRKKPLHIIFDDVWFGYQKDVPLLKNVSFEILPGQTLAIIGETGSGKSTIVSLLLGFLEPWKGRIIINGYDLKDVNQESLLGSIGIVPQEVTLFNDTISHNILYANMSASKSRLMNTLDIANLKKAIQKFPEGLETIVGERGAKLSGGEKQRVGLARAIIRQPNFYIFDEATSALDSKTETQIMKNIEIISRKASTLMIAHRLSMVAFADKILLLEKGSIKDRNYDSLINSSPD